MSYNGPGNIGELTEEQVGDWQSELDAIFERGVQVAKDEATPPHPRAWLFNPISEGAAGTTEADIRWNAFPKRLMDTFGSKLQAWREGDRTRDRQEEYCEWEVVRDPTDSKLRRVTFTTETPEYFDFLFREDPSLLLKLYRRFVSTSVQLSDLQAAGSYNPRNKWNMPELQGKKGVLMHMAFGPNTLGAAVNLSAEATWPSINDAGELITDEQGLIDCRGYGARERHSDPHIGAQINALVRAGNEVSLAGPSGLYVDAVDMTGVETPDGSDPNDWFRVVRGEAGFMLRVVFEPPAGSEHILGDLVVDEVPLVFGGQLAEKLTIRIRGLARPHQEAPPKLKCSGAVAVPAGIAPFLNLVASRREHAAFLISDE